MSTHTKNKFTVSNHRAGGAFAETQFFQWSQHNHYRTSSHDMNPAHVSPPPSSCSY